MTMTVTIPVQSKVISIPFSISTVLPCNTAKTIETVFIPSELLKRPKTGEQQMHHHHEPDTCVI